MNWNEILTALDEHSEQLSGDDRYTSPDLDEYARELYDRARLLRMMSTHRRRLERLVPRR